MRILVVEDDARIAGFLKKGLEESGYDVVVEENGEDGFLDARLNPYDLLVLDLMLPQMDGIEVACRVAESCPRLRCSDALPRVTQSGASAVRYKPDSQATRFDGEARPIDRS